jgi:hypothetical protein
MRLRNFVPLTVALSALVGCGGDEEPPIEPTYANVEMVVQRSCALSSVCHADRGSADLTFEGLSDITMPLNGVASCQYPPMPRVDPGNPDNSWLMIKLDGMYDGEGNIQFTPEPGFTPPTGDPNCETFGTIMPSNATPVPLPMREVTMFREWIRAGAPGPSGG